MNDGEEGEDSLSTGDSMNNNYQENQNEDSQRNEKKKNGGGRRKTKQALSPGADDDDEDGANHLAGTPSLSYSNSSVTHGGSGTMARPSALTITSPQQVVNPIVRKGRSTSSQNHPPPPPLVFPIPGPHDSSIRSYSTAANHGHLDPHHDLSTATARVIAAAQLHLSTPSYRSSHPGTGQRTQGTNEGKRGEDQAASMQTNPSMGDGPAPSPFPQTDGQQSASSHGGTSSLRTALGAAAMSLARNKFVVILFTHSLSFPYLHFLHSSFASCYLSTSLPHFAPIPFLLRYFFYFQS